MRFEKNMKVIRQRERVAKAVDAAVDVARENGVGPLSLSDLFMTMAAVFCKGGGVSRRDFLDAAAQHFDEALTAKPDELQH